jgi:salicylate hydroxylase
MTLISPALYESFKTTALFNGTEEKRSVAFRHQVGESGPDEGNEIIEVELPLGLEQSSANRKDFLDILVGCLPGGVVDCTEFGKRLVEVRDRKEEKLLCVFADGASVEADAVVGCDGIKSACRPFVFGTKSELSEPIFTGKIAYRGMVPMKNAIESLGEQQAKNRQMYLGHHGFLLSYAAAQGALLNVVGFHSTGTGRILEGL